MSVWVPGSVYLMERFPNLKYIYQPPTFNRFILNTFHKHTPSFPSSYYQFFCCSILLSVFITFHIFFSHFFLGLTGKRHLIQTVLRPAGCLPFYKQYRADIVGLSATIPEMFPLKVNYILFDFK